jgi:hypothetical protein
MGGRARGIPRSLETESYVLLDGLRLMLSREGVGFDSSSLRLSAIFGLFLRSEESGDGELLRKEVIQPQVPLRLPCYDFTPVTVHSLGPCLLAVGSGTSGANDSHGVTGGVYKARERIHRCLLISDY